MNINELLNNSINYIDYWIKLENSLIEEKEKEKKTITTQTDI